jgi:hypothetical protein
MEVYPSPYQAEPSNLGPYREAYGNHGLQCSGFNQHSQQTSYPNVKPDPHDLQAHPLFYNIPRYGKNSTSSEVYLDRTSSSGDIPFQRIAQPVTNKQHHNGQQWRPQEITYDPTGSPGDRRTDDVPPGYPFPRHPVDEQRLFKSEHGVTPFHHTPGSMTTSGNSPQDCRPKKAQRTANASSYP